MRLKNRKISPKSRLFTFGSHPHGVFLYWHLPKLHYEKWVQKSPEAASPLGFLGVASILDAQYGGATRNPPSHPVGGGTTRSGGTLFSLPPVAPAKHIGRRGWVFRRARSDQGVALHEKSTPSGVLCEVR